MKVKFYNSDYSFEFLDEDITNLVERVYLISEISSDNPLYGLLECVAQGRFSFLFQEIEFTHIQISK